MPLRLAFLGFRHGHILGLHRQAHERDDIAVIAAAEDHEPTRRQLADQVEFTHDDCRKLLDEVDCDAVAIGDYYGRRGELAVAALARERHVIVDKPVCTSPAELERMADLATGKGLHVGCQLDLRHVGKYLALRRLLQTEKVIGEIHAVSFGGQHPLKYGTRPDWYFEPGKHGGTINDIAIHGIDLLPLLTGHHVTRVNAARNWNARLKEVPHFRDAAQFLLTLGNGAGVFGDVSYLAPDSLAGRFPLYWRWTFWGEGGVIETDSGMEGAVLYLDGAAEAEVLPPDASRPAGCLGAFVDEINGATAVSPTTAEVLESSRVTLAIQRAADEGATDVVLDASAR